MEEAAVILFIVACFDVPAKAQAASPKPPTVETTEGTVIGQHPALTAESPDGTFGNQALQDHIQALRWLRGNLEHFGGDPRQITLFGESAGSTSICALLASPLSDGLFQRAILESGACQGAPTLEEAEAFGRRLAEALGCRSDDLEQELACMRSHTDEEVMTAIPLARVLGGGSEGVGYRFNQDGVVLPETPRDAVRNGHVHRIPVMLGTTDNEMARYTAGLGVSTAATFRALVAANWGAPSPVRPVGSDRTMTQSSSDGRQPCFYPVLSPGRDRP